MNKELEAEDEIQLYNTLKRILAEDPKRWSITAPQEERTQVYI